MGDSDLMEHEIEEIKKTFSYFDKAKSGHIKTSELGNALRWLKLVPSNKEIEEFSAFADPHDTGKIKFDTFVSVVKKQWISDPAQREGALWSAFLQFDKEDKGKLPEYRVREILMEIGLEPLTEKETTAIIKEAVDKDEMVEYGYLIRMWQK